MSQMALTPSEIKMLIQSLDHCLATCHADKKEGSICTDCEAAKALRQKLTTGLAA
jgi:hypothetical protein